MIENKTPFRVGQFVKINTTICDVYDEVWHCPGDNLQIKRIADDGEGLIFNSNLGTHYSNCELSKGETVFNVIDISTFI